jgi:hypothetical protein
MLAGELSQHGVKKVKLVIARLDQKLSIARMILTSLLKRTIMIHLGKERRYYGK